MHTPWGNIDISDAHAHFFSHSFFEGLAKQKSALGEAVTADALIENLGWDPPPADNAELAAQWVAELDRRGVQSTVLMASLPGDEESAADAARAFPERIDGYFMLNPLAPDAAERCRRAVGASALRGICLFPAMQRFSVRDERLRPIYEIAAEHPGVVVFVHMGVLSVGVRGKLGLPSKFDMSFSNPIELHSVALDFPRVPFVIPHFGAGYFREALMLGGLAPNVYLETSSSNSWMKYQIPPMELKAVFRQALDVYGAERLLFGSDSSFFPRGWNAEIFQAQSAALKELDIKADDARAVFGGNLRRLLDQG